MVLFETRMMIIFGTKRTEVREVGEEFRSKIHNKYYF